MNDKMNASRRLLLQRAALGGASGLGRLAGAAGVTGRGGAWRSALMAGVASSALAAGGPARSQEAPTRGIRGRPAPEIELDYWIDGAGEPTRFSVADSRGKWVFLKCFQNWCPGCHKSGFPTLKAFADAFHEHPDVAIAGIQTVFEGHSVNTREAVRELALRYDLLNVMGHDPGDPKTHQSPQTMQRYRTGGTPWLILIEPGGTVVFDGFHVDKNRLIDYVGEQLA